MENIFNTLYGALSSNVVVLIVVWCIMFDTFFGVLRALKERAFNSSFGIDGGIRKVGMIFSILFLFIADLTVHINIVGFVPKEYLEIFGISKIGMLEFFGLFFILYEAISILKNMYLVGIPMPIWLKDKLEKLLTQLTNEVPTKVLENDEIEE